MRIYIYSDITAVNIAVMLSANLEPFAFRSDDDNLISVMKNLDYCRIVVCALANIEEIVDTYCSGNLFRIDAYGLCQNYNGSQNSYQKL